MRANEEPDHQNVPGTSSPRVPLSRDDTHPPGSLPALQQSAGNAAVVRAIQRSRAEQPQEADAGVGDVLKSPGSRLSPHVRADMESRLGADFSDVQVHTGADARRSARDLGARAYTSGNHVVLGDGGGDQHTLAHELVHVVQQRTGPVAGTDTGTGLRVSDPGDRFEREAEATAQQVMAGGPPPGHDHPQEAAHAHSHPDDQAPVQRKVMAQIVAADRGDGAELKVDKLITSGRPDSPHSETEGDHTTAMVVLRQAVRRVVNGRTAAEAAEGVWDLYLEAKKLPGEALRPNLNARGKHARLLKQAEDELVRLHDLPDGEPWDMLRLQQLISEYFQYRGTLPLSTLNIKETGKPAGKGLGESWRVDPLNRYEAGDDTVSTDLIKDSVRGLLDSGAVINYAIEVEAASDRVAPGTVEDTTGEDTIGEETFVNRLKPVVKQHVASIAQVFPTAVQAAWGTPEAAEEELAQWLEDRLPAAKAAEVERLLGRLAAVRKEGKNKTLAEQYERNLLAYGETPPPAPEEKLGRGERIKNKGKGILSDVAESPRKVGRAIGSHLRRLDQTPAEDTALELGDERAVDDGELDDNEPGIATQLVIGEDGKITEMRLAGRAASPFPGTMGAHTTAWIAHVDSIGTQLVGKDVTAAVKELPGLVEHVKQVAKRLEIFEQDDATEGLTAGLASTRISEQGGEEAPAPDQDASRVDVEAVQATMVRVVKAATDAAVTKPTGTQAVLLQQAVGAILQRLNIIPGVTRDATDTRGSAEGTYRAMLRTGTRGRKKEAMKRKDYRVAIFGLLDLKEDLDEEQRLALMGNHLAVIEMAYPGVLAKASLSVANPDTALSQWDKERKGKDKDAGGLFG